MINLKVLSTAAAAALLLPLVIPASSFAQQPQRGVARGGAMHAGAVAGAIRGGGGGPRFNPGGGAGMRVAGGGGYRNYGGYHGGYRHYGGGGALCSGARTGGLGRGA